MLTYALSSISDSSQELNYDKYSLLGWSVGGITGLMLASLFPNSVQKVVVWGSAAKIREKDAEYYKCQ